MAYSTNPNSPQPMEMEMSIVPWEASEVPEQSGRSWMVSEVLEWPEWLPDGWSVEVRTRTTGKTAGVKDRFYYDPISHRQFRSRKEVEHFLATGTKRRYTPQSRAMKPETPRPSVERFDFNNPPAKVSWVLTNASQELWTPYVNGEEVSEPTIRLWATTMEEIMNGTYSFQSS